MHTQLETGIVALQLELTNVCPLTCAECAYTSQTRKKGHMSLSLAQEVIDGCLAAFGPISFNLNGLGEPLSYKLLPNVIRYIGRRSPGSRIELFTSLATNEEQGEAAARALAEVPNPVLLASTIHSYGVDGEIMKHAGKAGPVMAIFRRILGDLPRIDFHVAMNRTTFTPDGQAERFREGFLPMFGEDKVHVVERLDSWLGTVTTAGPGGYSDVTQPAVCDYPFKVLHVAWNGDVLICCTDDVHGELKLGTITTAADVKQIWTSPLLDEIRLRHNALDVKGLSPCDRCGRTKGYLAR